MSVRIICLIRRNCSEVEVPNVPFVHLKNLCTVRNQDTSRAKTFARQLISDTLHFVLKLSDMVLLAWWSLMHAILPYLIMLLQFFKVTRGDIFFSLCDFDDIRCHNKSYKFVIIIAR